MTGRTESRDAPCGTVVSVAGPVVKATGMAGSRMYDVVRVGTERLTGEIIQLKGDSAVIQVYEETAGLSPGSRVERTGRPLSVLLGPGLISMIYDGIQRPLDAIRERTGDFITRGIDVPPLEMGRKWWFKPVLEPGTPVGPGDVLGTVQETPVVVHKVMVPPEVQGRLEDIVPEGDYTVEETVARVNTGRDTVDVAMAHYWPVRRTRPILKKIDPSEPLVTGQRILDTFFPMAKGGTAAIPGGFGTGKTVTQHQLAKWSNADVIVYVGCGERGNEMTDVLTEFPELEDPRTGEPLMNRTVLIANTSNMPVAAREASIYTGITIAEYYRDMGYDIALMADSTSRWAEALREISGRLEEMPGEEGYPAYIASRLAEFYERAGVVRALGSPERKGSVSVIGAVSPPGGDFSEPVTQNTLRIVKVFWALDADLADRRHFPSINWLKSYSLYLDQMEPYWRERVGPRSTELRTEAMALLQRESELKEIIQLVGPDALPPAEQAALEAARAIREDFLQQNAFHEVDTYCPPEKQYLMMEVLMEYGTALQKWVRDGHEVSEVREMDIFERIGRMATVDNSEFRPVLEKLKEDIRSKIGGYSV